jgi:hypothetical protein
MASKSANYALSGHDKRKALMLLSEVALGSPQSLYDADYEMCTKKLATIDKHSVLGVGRWMPDSGASKTILSVRFFSLLYFISKYLTLKI